MSKELSYLKENLRGPILKIQDPANHPIDEILKSYFREIVVIARKYVRPAVDFEDLVAEGIMGLLDAIKRWDPERANNNPSAFHNLAIVRIKSNMFEFFLANNSSYSIPNYMARAITLVDQTRNLIESFYYQGDRKRALLTFEDTEFEASLTAEQKSKVTRLKDRIARLASNSGKTYEEMVANVLRVESEIENHAQQSEEFEVSPHQIAEDKEFLDKFLKALKPDARDIIVALIEGDTLEQAGARKGFTHERARQIKEEALSFFRRTKMYRDAHE